VLVARRAAELERTLGACNGHGRIVVCDVASLEDLTALAESVKSIEGVCHILVNNAGISSGGVRIGDDDWLSQLDHLTSVNYLSAARLTHLMLPSLTLGSPSSVVNVSSVTGLHTTPRADMYSASKFALTGLSEALNIELSSRGIFVAAVHPGPVPTEGWPHSVLMSRTAFQWLAADVADVAEVIVRTAVDRSNSMPVVPRWYRWPLLLKVLSPRLYRAAIHAVFRERR